MITPPTSPPPTDREADYFIFLDPRGKRWPRLRLIILIASILFLVCLTLFAQTLLVPSQFHLPTSVQQLKSRLKALQAGDLPERKRVTRPLWLNFDKALRGQNTPQPTANAVSPHQPLGPGLPAGQEIHLGFYESWDPDSIDALKANLGQLTHISPDWITLSDGDGQFTAIKDEALLETIKGSPVVLLPLLSNMSRLGHWLPDVAEGLINGPAASQESFQLALIKELLAMGAGGIVLDLEDIDPTYRQAMTTFLTGLASALHRQDLELWLCVPMGQQLNVYDLDTLAQEVDRFVAMLHDENGEADPPGPIASHEWFNGWLETLIDEYGEPAQWVLALGSYGYDWQEGATEAAIIRFQDVMSRAYRSGLTRCEMDEQSKNPHFAYENGGIAHTVWFLDAVTFASQLSAGREHHVGGVAISRLGTEDPGLWQALRLADNQPPSLNDLKPLTTITPRESIANFDRGNFLSMEVERAAGQRQISVSTSDDQLLIDERYEKFPIYTTIVHQGSAVADGVTLTFDDGPDPEWTPQILDILKEKGVKATFFVVGANVEQSPSLLRRMVREGHTVGIHTYTHPNIALVSEERAKLEFNASQRLIEAISGRSTILFRPPYNADTNPHEPEELVPIKLAQSLGYITVSEDIDPEDWLRPGTQAIVDNVRLGRMLGGDIVLLHDAGGDRRQTVAALPQIIDYLRLRGDQLISLPEMLGSPLDQLMPPVPPKERSLSRMISGLGFRIIHTLTDFFWGFMIVATILVVIRTVLIAALAIVNQRREPPPSTGGEAPAPAVSVLIAAYNEEKVIGETLRALLATSYPGELEILVVDDGSSDQTAAIVLAMAQRDGRIHLLSQANGGKACALRRGLAEVSHELVVSLDADTQFEPQTISELVRPLADPKVGAVSGRARVGNPHTLMANFQSLEYTCGFNLDRRAYHQLNCITVVPGAVSALRKSAVMAVGGISTDTLAEDTDLTLSLHKGGYLVAYSAQAVAWTEAPETMRAFVKQRLRWAFGTLQCLWKHRELLFNAQFGALAWFSLPGAWFFNIFLVAIGPLIDFILLTSLIISPANTILYFYFVIFLVADLVLALVACRIEGESWQQIRLVLPMRFVYRPLLSYAVARSIFKAIKGVWVGWGKLDRTASVGERARGDLPSDFSE